MTVVKNFFWGNIEIFWMNFDKAWFYEFNEIYKRQSNDKSTNNVELIYRYYQQIVHVSKQLHILYSAASCSRLLRFYKLAKDQIESSQDWLVALLDSLKEHTSDSSLWYWVRL